jgi:hypothetical protein
MSKANITSMNPADFSVTFALRNGDSRTYYYDPASFAAILGGSDPKDFTGSQDPPVDSAIGGEIGTSIGDALLDIGEIGAAL